MTGTQQTAAIFIPERPTLPKLQSVAPGCTACDLYKSGTQTVQGFTADLAMVAAELAR